MSVEVQLDYPFNSKWLKNKAAWNLCKEKMENTLKLIGGYIETSSLQQQQISSLKSKLEKLNPENEEKNVT